MPPTTRKAPADHKAKAQKPGAYTFEHDVTDPKTKAVTTKTFVIPPPSDVLATIPGREFRDALMNGDEGQLKFSFVCLEKVVTDETVLDALYNKPVPETLEIVAAWFKSADPSGATLPQS